MVRFFQGARELAIYHPGIPETASLFGAQVELSHFVAQLDLKLVTCLPQYPK